MDHTTAKELASRSLETPLEDSQERDLAVHLVGCSDCKALYEGLHGISGALRRLVPARVPDEVVASAVHRAATVLQGDADPGPLARPTVDLPQARPNDTPVVDLTRPEPVPTEEPAPLVEEPAAVPLVEEPAVRPPEPEPEPPEPPPIPEDDVSSHVRIHRPDPAGPPPPTPATLPPTEVAQVIWQEDEPAPPRSRGPFALAALLGTALVLGIVAFFVLAGENPDPVADLPTTEEVRRRVATAFEELESLRTGYRIERLSIYRLPGADRDERVAFSFSLATETGRVVYEAPDRLREERSLQIPDAAPVSTERVRTADTGTRTLVVEATSRRAEVLSDPALGPPEGQLASRLGVLDPAVSSAVRLMLAAPDLRVTDEVTVGDARAIRVRFSTEPDPFTRADRVEIALDAQTYFPLRVERSLSKEHATVLGPPELLTASAIETAFGERDRIVVERVVLTGPELNGVVVPGEFRLEFPEGVEPGESSAGFRTASRDALSEVPWDVLHPTELPQGFREQAWVVYEGSPADWGPRGNYPAPTGVVQTLYSDGRTSVVVDQRQVTRGPFDVSDSPLPGATMPTIDRKVVVDDDLEFTYAVSPELPPHVFGWVEDVFVVVSGHLTADELVAIAASLAPQQPRGTPQPTP